MRFDRFACVAIASLLFSASPLLTELVAAQASVEELTKELVQLADSITTPSEQQTLARQLPDYVNRLRQRSNQASTEAWAAINSRDDWQRFRDEQLERLRQSLGQPSPPTELLSVAVRRQYSDPAQRFVVENVVYRSRPNVWVTANLYRPTKTVTSAPGIVISHAHHTSKEHAELQAMGMTWAQAGCYVLIPDHFGHGERRQHPFVSAESFAGNFRVSRQDYYFRYDNGIKLHLLGESLMSWLAWDLSRGVDCLLQQPGIDSKKIILLGAVAGGGDPCAVAAALDERIAAAVPFNFGGPQPETVYPLPEDAQSSFNYAGSGSWESTRNLNNSTAAGFMPWVIVGSLAPRRLVYGHEFRWDQERDPVWKRLQTIYQFYGLPEHLDFTHGRGELRGQAPEATHCTHIGAVHRQRIHEAFRRWFQIDVSPDHEILEPLPVEALRCLEVKADTDTKLTSVTFEPRARKLLAGVRQMLADQPVAEYRQELQQLWKKVLSAAGPSNIPQLSTETTLVQRHTVSASTLRVESVTLSSEDGLKIPLVLLWPKQADASKKLPMVLAIRTSGRVLQLRQQAPELARLLAAGHAVCMCDLRGTNDGQAGRGRSSAATSLSSSLLMLGDPLVAGQLRDLRTVWGWLRSQTEIDAQRMQVWGDSRAATVTAETDRVVPRDDDALVPPAAEPAACLLALLLSLYEDSVQSLCLSGGLSNFRSALGPTQIRLPHDCVIPGMFRAGDIEELIVQAAERVPVRCESFVDGHNRSMTQPALDEYESQLKRLCSSDSQLNLTIKQDSHAVDWLLR